MIPPWINQTLGRDFFDQTKTLLEPRTVTGEIACFAWKVLKMRNLTVATLVEGAKVSTVIILTVLVALFQQASNARLMWSGSGHTGNRSQGGKKKSQQARSGQ